MRIRSSLSLEISDIGKTYHVKKEGLWDLDGKCRCSLIFQECSVFFFSIRKWGGGEQMKYQYYRYYEIKMMESESALTFFIVVKSWILLATNVQRNFWRGVSGRDAVGLWPGFLGRGCQSRRNHLGSRLDLEGWYIYIFYNNDGIPHPMRLSRESPNKCLLIKFADF